MTGSLFNAITAQGDGSVGYFDVGTIRGTVSSTSFTSVTQQAAWLSIYGGVFRVKTMGALVLDTVTATTISAKAYASGAT